jgi:nucleoside-diphosphate-sugar epimerase
LGVLVTGGGGFLGRSICRQLAAQGLEPIAFQRSAAPELASEGISVIPGDIRDPAEVSAACRGCVAVVHTAGKAGVWGDPGEYRAINVNGTRNVIDACREHDIPTLVHTSSPSVVHAGEDIENGNESLPIADHFNAPYPETKAKAERLVLAANSDSLRTTALRPHLIWGPGDPHILPRLAAKAKGGRLALPGPDKIIDTIFVDNAAQAHVQALHELQGSGRCAGKPYFVTNHEPLPQGEIIARLLEALGIDVKIKPVPVGVALSAGAVAESAWKWLGLKGEPPVTRFSVEQLATAHWFDPSAAERDFGYKPRLSIAEGLEILKNQGL